MPVRVPFVDDAAFRGDAELPKSVPIFVPVARDAGTPVPLLVRDAVATRPHRPEGERPAVVRAQGLPPAAVPGDGERLREPPGEHFRLLPLDGAGERVHVAAGVVLPRADRTRAGLVHRQLWSAARKFRTIVGLDRQEVVPRPFAQGVEPFRGVQEPASYLL